MIAVPKTKFNIFVIGESLVGKTCIIKSFCKQGFKYDEFPTVCLENFKTPMTYDNIEYQFKFFDISGKDKYKKIVSPKFRLADGFIYVFSIDNTDSLNKIDKWIQLVDESTKIKKKKILIGNKIDITKREIANETALNFAKERNMKYFEVSAKTGYRIEDTISSFCKELYESNKQLENQKKSE